MEPLDVSEAEERAVGLEQPGDAVFIDVFQREFFDRDGPYF